MIVDFSEYPTEYDKARNKYAPIVADFSFYNFLSKDLSKDFPGVSGFSPRNLRYMRKFAESYADPSILQALLARIPYWSTVFKIS